jgi:hypothetical protein
MFHHQSELALVSMWDVKATANLTARVDFGSLQIGTSGDYHGTFAAHSPYGFLSFRHADDVEHVKLTKETLAEFEGEVAHVSSSGVAKSLQHMSLDALYGSIDLFIASPEKQHQ